MKQQISLGARTGFLYMVALVVSKLIGAVYKLPLINLIGAEGMGYYQQVYPVFAFLLTATSGAIPMAFSSILSESFATNNGSNAYSLYVRVRKIVTTLGLIATIVMVFIAGILSDIQGNANLRLLYFAIAPSVTIVAEMSLTRGWYQAKLDMRPTAFSQVAEQVFKLIFGLILAYVLSRYGVIYAAAGAMLGVTISELFVLVLLRIIYKSEYKRQEYRQTVNTDNSILKRVFPMTLSGMVSPFVGLVDSLIVVALLMRAGYTQIDSVSLFGLYGGAVLTLANVPTVLIISVTAVIVPYLVGLHSERNIDGIRRGSALCGKLGLTIALPVALLYFVFAEDLIRLIYPAISATALPDTAAALKISGLSVIFVAEVQTGTGILNGIGGESTALKCLMTAGILKIGLTVVLTLWLGIVGTALSAAIAYFVTAVVARIIRGGRIGKDYVQVKTAVQLCLSAFVMAVFGGLMRRLFVTNTWLAAVAIVLAGAVYCIMIFLSGAYRLNELTDILKIVKLKGKE